MPKKNPLSFQLNVDDFIPATEEERQSLTQLRPSVSFFKDGMVEGYADVASGAKTPDTLGVSAPDDNTFIVKLATPCPYFDKLAAFPTLSPVNQATIEKNGDSWATKADTYICNGPFYISEWVPSSYIVFKKNPNYRDAASIKLDSIKLLLMEDPNAAYAAYTTGSALMIKDVPTAEIPNLRSNADFHDGFDRRIRLNALDQRHLHTRFLQIGNRTVKETAALHARQNKCAIDLIMIAKYFERIADHSVNIANWTEFCKTGYYKSARII